MEPCELDLLVLKYLFFLLLIDDLLFFFIPMFRHVVTAT